jgi:hypothetical protein
MARDLRKRLKLPTYVDDVKKVINNQGVNVDHVSKIDKLVVKDDNEEHMKHLIVEKKNGNYTFQLTYLSFQYSDINIFFK